MHSILKMRHTKQSWANHYLKSQPSTVLIKALQANLGISLTVKSVICKTDSNA